MVSPPMDPGGRSKAMATENQRLFPRRRTRLRGGKIADMSDRFISECKIFDTSEGGVGLLVATDVPLPKEIVIFDDLEKKIALARVVWRRGKQVGLAFEIPPAPVSMFKAQRLHALQFNFYAVDPE